MPSSRLLAVLSILLTGLLLAASGGVPPPPASDEVKAQLSAALSRRFQAAPAASSLTLSLFTPELDDAFLTPDGQTAVLWLALREQNGRRIASEPGLALAQSSTAGWQVLLPGDPGWQEAFSALSQSMLPLEQQPAPLQLRPSAAVSPAALTGYYLPYAAGTARWLEGSISHFQSVPARGYPSCAEEYCHYAYDFTDSDHFPLLASKGGTVIGARDSCSDGNPLCTNYIVLQDAGQQTYQIYLHLAYGTIPDKLAPGAAVVRGQYLGDSDDTGYSTSQHVHFMVTDSLWIGGDGYYWGRSVNVHFADVPINAGIPRTCYEVTHFAIYDGAAECLGSKDDPLNPANDWFVSGNVGAYPPTGALTRPAAGATVAAGSNPLMDVTALVGDDVGVTALRLVARINGSWTEIGPKVTQPAQPGLYDWDVNLCSVAPLNGPLEVALRAWDYEGNVSELLSPRTIQVDYACPPPASQLKPAETFASTAVRLSWDVTDPGTGLGSFELQWRGEPGAWDAASALVFPAAQRSTWISGQPGGSYAFRLRALDTGGQPEPWPAGNAAETAVSLPAACVPDAAEPDDTPAQAAGLPLRQWAQRNLCAAPDSDWFRVVLPNADGYFVSALSQNGGAAVRLTVYAQDGSTPLASAEAPDLAQGVSLFFQPPAPGVYYIQSAPLVPNLMGTDAVYRIAVFAVQKVHLPLISR